MNYPQEVIDQCQRVLKIDAPPERIVSLVPSQTELLVDLGLEDQLVGITRFCVHPEHLLDQKKVVGGTKKVVMNRIKELQPDLIIANKEENTKEIVEQCQGVATTYVSDINNLEESLEMIKDVSRMCDRRYRGDALIKTITQSFNEIGDYKPLKALYLIWKDPYLSVGNDTFIHDMMGKAKLQNVMEQTRRYPELSLDVIKMSPAEVILLSSEPYNFTETDVAEMENSTGKKVVLVDGELFSWYGSRLVQSPRYFKSLREGKLS